METAREQAREEKEREKAGKRARLKKEEGEEKSERRRGKEDEPVADSAGVNVSFRVGFGVGLFHHIGEEGVRQEVHQACPSGG